MFNNNMQQREVQFYRIFLLLTKVFTRNLINFYVLKFFFSDNSYEAKEIEINFIQKT